jgi:hypothetical protein
LNQLLDKIHAYLDDIHNAIISIKIIAIMGLALKMIRKINFTFLVTELMDGHAYKFKLKMTHFQDVKVPIKDHAWKMVHKMKLSNHAMVLICHAFKMLLVIHYVINTI